MHRWVLPGASGLLTTAFAISRGDNHKEEAEDELLQFIGGFDGECPTTNDFCDDIDFDLLTPPASPFFGMATAHDVFNDDSESMQRSSNSGVTTKYEKEEVVASLLSEGSLLSEDSCFAGLHHLSQIAFLK